jgi:hypothetical protein
MPLRISNLRLGIDESEQALPDVADARQVVRRSCQLERFEPCEPARWEEVYGRFPKRWLEWQQEVCRHEQ